MVAFPPCKINLGLHVLSRRPDVYHEIETCFYPVPRTDILEIVPSKEFRFELTGLKLPGASEDNICVKAHQLLLRDHHIPAVEIHLHKLIPPGSGLGGGSSDGTWTLRVLNSLFDLKLSASKLGEYAASLGSDCPYFLYDSAMIGSGRGEKLTSVGVSLKGRFLVIVRPDVHVSTKEAYQAVTPASPVRSIKSIVEGFPPEKWKGQLINKFEDSVVSRFPLIGQVRDDLYRHGAVYASLSGSGSAVYGIFDKETNISTSFKGMDYWSGWLTV